MMSSSHQADAHRFAMIPRADVPRASFKMDTVHKTTFQGGNLIPIYVQEILPGDTFNVRMTSFCRLATPLYPIMDEVYLDTFFFFVPARLLWDNWHKFNGEQTNPGDSISYVIPQIVSPAGGFPRYSIYDYMGLPCTPNLGANTISINALPIRAYGLIYNEWFRDENLTNSLVVSLGAGPDASTAIGIMPRLKRHDYFTSALPWPQKGVSSPLLISGTAPVRTSTSDQVTGVQAAMAMLTTAGAVPAASTATGFAAGAVGTGRGLGSNAVAFAATNGIYPSNLYADLSAATSNTINQLRQAFQIQRLLERDARGGTRYTEILRAHFGVISPDARLQRPEYLGGGTVPINITPVAQSTQTGLTGGSTPLGTLGAVGAAVARGIGFIQSFTEHGYVLGIIAARAAISYQQGLRKLWSRSTRYDFYWPAFAHLGEQAILNKEIYTTGVQATDDAVFGYQERWAEYRYHPSQTTGFFNSTTATPLDAWHLAEKFGSAPALNSTFLADPTGAVLSRALAAGAAANNQQIIGDIFFDVTATRPMPIYSVPGMMDHF